MKRRYALASSRALTGPRLVEDELRAAAGGFTLIEVVASISVLAVLSLSIGLSVATAMQAEHRAQERDAARSEAASELEEILAWPEYGTLQTTFDGRTFAVEGLSRSDGTMVGSVDVYQIAAETLRADVRVTWTDNTLGTDLLYEISTVVTNVTSMGGS